MSVLKSGLAFWLVCDRGFAVGLMTHHIETMGHLVWMAEPVFDDEPAVDDIQKIKRWRWPVFFPLSAAIRRKIVTPIGVVSVPSELAPFPVLRDGPRTGGWMALTYKNGDEQLLGLTQDSTIPISQIVNDTLLKEMLVTDWRPEQEW